MKLSKFINRIIFSIAFFSTLLAFLVSIIFQYTNFERDKNHIQKEFIELKKNELKKEIQVIFNLIDCNEKVIEKLIHEVKDKTIVEKIRKNNQNDILNFIASYRFANNGYVFVNNLNHQALIWDGKRLETPILYPSESLYQQQLDAAKNQEGDFIFYKFKKINTIKEFDKITFVKKYEKYNWIIGTGAYLDEIENEINRKEAIFRKSIENQIKSLLLIFVLILIAIYIISKKLSKYIKMNVNNLTLSFEKAAKENKKINTNNLTYKEFVSLANNLNIALENKNKIEKELQDYIMLVKLFVKFLVSQERN
jgi:signal transduction histidine kinase